MLCRRLHNIENLNADMKASALAHFPSGMFTANAAWLGLACIAFNVTRAAGTLASGALGKAVTATVRRKLINVATRISTSARHLPEHRPCVTGWLVDAASTGDDAQGSGRT